MIQECPSATQKASRLAESVSSFICDIGRSIFLLSFLFVNCNVVLASYVVFAFFYLISPIDLLPFKPSLQQYHNFGLMAVCNTYE